MRTVVSFDIFDTAIIRLLSTPKDVFGVVEKYIDEQYGIESNYRKKRIMAEQIARQKYGKREITIDDIASELPYTVDQNLQFLADEIEVEKMVCRANKDIFDVYLKCLKHGYDVIFMSDMYLPKEVIEILLNKCGYTVYDKLYVSSEYGFTKNAGNLYRFVIDDLNIRPNELVHIGNNLKSDFLVPRSMFIKAKYYKYMEVGHGSNLINQIVTKMAKVGLKDRVKMCGMGYSVFGPMTVGFVDWIHSQCIEKKKIFFLSRDGYLLKTVYDDLYDDGKTCYIRISRRALRNAIMALNLPYSEFCNTIPPFKTYDYTMLLDILELNEDQIVDIKNKYGDAFNMKVGWVNVPNNKLFVALYQRALSVNKAFYNQQHDLLKKYLVQNNFEGDIGIVDLSFKGTAFNLLKMFCESVGKKVTMDGYVIGKADEMQERIGDVSKSIHGWIFEEENQNPLAKVLISNATVYERFLFDDAGTTLAYRECDGFVEAVLDENNEQKNVETITIIRDEILRYSRDIKCLYKMLDERIDGDLVIKSVAKFFLNPERSCVNEIGDMIEQNVIDQCIAKPRLKKEYAFKWNELIKDLKNSFWKQGFLCRLFGNRWIVRMYNLFYFYKKGISLRSGVNFLRELK